MKKKLIVVLSMLVGLIILSHISGHGWIIYREGTFKGRVIDAESKEPIKEAVVVAIYNVRVIGFIESNSIPVTAKEVLTNKDGEFYIPFHIFFYLSPCITGNKEETHFLIYKPGYARSEGPEYIKLPDGSIQISNYLTRAQALRDGTTVELPKLNNWEERNRAIMISISDIPKSRWTLLNEMVEKEEDWLNHNKGWRREEE